MFGIRYISAKPDAPPSDVLPPADIGPDGMTSYAAAVLEDGPVGYFRLGETTGVTAANLVGPPGTYVGAFMLGVPGALRGDPDGALGLEYAMPGAVDVGDHYDFPGMAPFSIEAWVYPAPDDGHSHIIVSKWQQPTTNYGYELFRQGAKIAFSRELPSSADVVSADALTDGQWNHIVGTFDGSMLRLYVNGTRAATAGPAIVALADDNNSFQIGTGGNAPFAGTIDEVAVYDKELPAASVNAHYHASGR